MRVGWCRAISPRNDLFPWTGVSRDHAHRVAQAWLGADDVIVGVGDVAWFDITAEGSERLAQRDAL